MTGTREPQQGGRIQAMLQDAGLESSTELRRSLEELSALVPDRAPAPRADLAALMAAGSFASAAATTTAMPAVPSAPDSVKAPSPRTLRASPSAADASAGWQSSAAPFWAP